MKRIPRFVFLVLLFCGCDSAADYSPRDGDIIFQISESRQSKAIQLATNSPYSHMGMVFVENGQGMVFEAVGPVKVTPLDAWIARGKQGHYVVKRLKRAGEILIPETLEGMRKIGESRYLGKPYDKYFEWSNDRIYCSELVWKIYREGAGVEIGTREKLGDLDLSHPEVQELMLERFGGPAPEDEPVISPAAIFASGLLETVFEKRQGTQ